MTLLARRNEMAKKLARAHMDESSSSLAVAQREAEFEYRRDITDDIEKILADAGEPLSLYERDSHLRRLAEDICAYITKDTP